ncbi:DUF4087 domain-containing protein [Tabrizicola sp.]|uniref:DUF4087 domain-containing protein n=1 Tax=Tabrizicola sp. TaxID=2005166 RepID=UPI0027335FCD|nr:DUF4087 domain-containing protein [Tabrizicola sp.]MDP3195952.1 DUF4087 domain-containing protein [Tabrizicola sp.]
MLRPLVLLLLAAPAHAETRCGWFDHPSPNLVDLIDADGLWSIAWPGSGTVYYPPGYDEAYTRAFDDRVRINSSGEIITEGAGYGYSCACVEGEFDRNKGEALSISRLTELPLAQCKADPKLPDMNPWVH